MRYIKKGFGATSGVVTALATLLIGAITSNDAAAQSCARTLTADVVAMDQSFFYSRFGASNPAGMVYALEEDVVSTNGYLREHVMFRMLHAGPKEHHIFH